ncbi:MAG: hypothetical protein IPK14_07695 [Blastocatellia bacterium]|nr:hypothetical protein [Blastocatellia bacterium]
MKRRSINWLILGLIFTVIFNVVGIAQSSNDPVRGQELITLAKQAIGGEARLNEVKGLGLEAKAIGQDPTKVEKLKLMFASRALAGVPGVMDGEINVHISKADPNAPEQVRIFTDDKGQTHKIAGDKTIVFMSNSGNAQVVDSDATKVTITKHKDDENKEASTEKRMIVITKEHSGNVPADAKVEKRNVIINAEVNSEGGGHAFRQPFDLAHTMIGLLLNSSIPLEFSYVGEVENGTAFAISVKDKIGFSGTLLLDKATYLPIGLNYRNTPQAIFLHVDKNAGGKIDKAEIEKLAQAQNNLPAEEISLRFSDHRLVDGVLLPYRIARSVNGELKATYEVEKFEINPNIEAIRMRRQKPDQN